MTVAEELRPLLDLMDQAAVIPMSETTPEMLRGQYEQLSSMRVREAPTLADVVDATVPGPAGDLPVRVYVPEGAAPHPVTAYFHGGGFVIGSIETHDGTCRELAARSGSVVVSVEYRLAPEHPFPAARDDCAAAVRWLAEHAADLGGDPRRLAVAGDSAGGNLAAVTALGCRGGQGPALAAQVLVYPVTDAGCDTPSYVDNAEGYFLTAESMRWFWEHYLVDASQGDDPSASPLRAADLSDLPPTLVVTAEYDPLRDEGERYAAALRDAGVGATATRYDGMVHGFFSFLGITPRADDAHDEVASFLRRCFAADSSVVPPDPG